MAGFWGALGNVAAKGVVAYEQQQEDNTRALILEKARQAAAQRQRQMDAIATEDRAHRLEQDRIGNVIKGYTPPSTTVALRPDLRPTPAPPAFGEALERGLSNATTPLGGETPAGTLTAPLRHGDLGAIPNVEVTNTPESFTDPEIARKELADRLAAQRDEAQAQRSDARLDKTISAQDRRSQAAIDAADRRAAADRASSERRAASRGVAEKAPTETQTKAGMFGARMENAERILSAHETKGHTTTGLAAANATPVIGGYLRNRSSTPDQQQYQQAQEDWVRAKLRFESGAAIGKDEMLQEIATYFPQPGDGPAKIAQKAAARREATMLLKQSAGSAGKLFTPPPSRSGDSGNVDLGAPARVRPDVRRVIDKYGLEP